MKTEYAKNLYNDLMNLVNETDSSFYFTDQEENGQMYRIFNYRLASYTEFLKPNALNCRGTMFYINENNEFLGLAALPPAKFFNDSENPSTMGLDYTQTDIIMDKMDGSLMTSYDPSFSFNDIKLKSKGSIKSEQAIAANKLLNSEQYANLLNYIKSEHSYGNCVSLEYTSPNNMIVIAYPEDRLTVLEVRSMITGEEIHYNDVKKAMIEYECEDYLVDVHTPADFSQFIKSIPDMSTDIEGFVIRLKNGMKVKVKTDSYVNLHKTISYIENDNNLLTCILDNIYDDLISKFHTNEVLKERIFNIKFKLKNIYKLIEDVDFYIKNNKYLDRKSFAIQTMKCENKALFGYCMAKYSNKDYDLKEFFLRNFDILNQFYQDCLNTSIFQHKNLI